MESLLLIGGTACLGWRVAMNAHPEVVFRMFEVSVCSPIALDDSNRGHDVVGLSQIVGREGSDARRELLNQKKTQNPAPRHVGSNYRMHL